MLAVTLRENALTTLDALKTSLGIDPEEEDAQRDATLVQLINAASAWLETQLGRKLGKSTYRQKYCGTGTQMLSLEQYPIVSVERITDTFTGETITDFDFNETGEIGVLFREDGWTYRGHIGGLAYDYIAPRKYLEVQYVAGYILPKDATEDHPATLPADLEAIVWYMIAQQWAIIENDAAGLSAFSIDNCNVTVNIKANGATHVGGLVGTGLYYYGEETVFKITNCSVKGSIDGAVTPGTVAGRAEGSTIESCTADVTIDENAGTEQVGTTTQMYESADQ